MNVGRLAFRSLLALAIVALVAGCASPPSDEAGPEESLPANETAGEAPGCIEEGQTGSGDGDIAADDVCPGAGDEDNSTLP